MVPVSDPDFDSRLVLFPYENFLALKITYSLTLLLLVPVISVNVLKVQKLKKQTPFKII